MAILIPLLPFILLLHSFNLSVLAQEENQFIYNGFQPAQAPRLHLDGVADIHPNGLLQLTNTSTMQIGHAFYPSPINFNKSSPGLGPYSFSTSFVFAIFPELQSKGGHGIAFTISQSINFTGATGAEYLGLLNSSNNNFSSNHVVAIEFDTVKSLALNDIDNNHVGIDVNGLISINSTTAAYFSIEGKKKPLQLISGKPIQVWIDYDEAEKLVSVTVAPFEKPRPSQPLLVTAVNLSLIMVDSMYVGFSSATGTVTSTHYILGWSFNRSGQAQSLEISKLPSLPKRTKSREEPDLKIAISVVSVAFVLSIIAATAYIRMQKKYEELREDWELEYGSQRYSFKELYKATKGFAHNELLGSGGSGQVFRGIIASSNTQVAVQKLSHDSEQGMREFVAEIVSMGRLRHRNLVQLLGYCRRRGELLLVYEYMPNGSLDRFLFRDETPKLPWFQRYQILKGVASSLLYLHEQWEQVVLHRDVKSSNVLLDADLNARLGDFGLARLCDHGSLLQTTRIVGTVGYLAPELSTTGKATTSTDVFSFGVFMLEVACGRKPVEIREVDEETILVEWVFDSWKRGGILDTVDPRLDGEYGVTEMELVLKLGLLCLQYMPTARPSMRQIVQFLDGNAVFPEIPPERLAIGTLGTSKYQETEEFMVPCSSSFEMVSSDSLGSSNRQSSMLRIL